MKEPLKKAWSGKGGLVKRNIDGEDNPLIQGDPNQNFPFSNGYNTETKFF